MTQQPADNRPARFVAALERLDRGPLAGLRRGLGGDERSVYWLEGLYARTGYGGAKPYEKEALQLAAGLFALKPGRDDGEEEGEVPDAAVTAAKAERAPSLGTLMGRLYLAQGERPSTEKRFLALLDADRDGLNYQMRQAVTLLAAGDLTPDWTRLTTDLLHWGDGVRRTWARDFYREISRETSSKTQPAGEGRTEADDATPTFSPDARADVQGDDSEGDLL